MSVCEKNPVHAKPAYLLQPSDTHVVYWNISSLSIILVVVLTISFMIYTLGVSTKINTDMVYVCRFYAL